MLLANRLRAGAKGHDIKINKIRVGFLLGKNGGEAVGVRLIAALLGSLFVESGVKHWQCLNTAKGKGC